MTVEIDIAVSRKTFHGNNSVSRNEFTISQSSAASVFDDTFDDTFRNPAITGGLTVSRNEFNSDISTQFTETVTGGFDYILDFTL